LYLADRHGWTRFVSMQNHYNLLNREEEREMMPLCQAEGIGVLPWSPLARGRLARPWQIESTKRFETDQFGKALYSKTEEADRKVVDRLGELSETRGVPRAQLAVAWMLGKPFVTSPIVGATESSCRCGRRTIAATYTRRDGVARRAVHAAPGTRFQLSR
jgi:aryl-alcohol dehydrogenase-like predicted oxidoreductase